MNQPKSRIASIRFATKHCPSPANLPHGIKPKMKWVSTAYSEAALLPLYPMIFCRQEGRSLSQSLRLSRLFASTYSSLLLDSRFRKLPSAAASTLAPEVLTEGHGFVSIPAQIDATTQDILYLHGYGGNMLYNLWQLSQLFPKDILLLPSWSLGWPARNDENVARVSGYLGEFISAVQSHFDIQIPAPWLVALSGGGPIAFGVAAANPQGLRGLVAVATSAGNAQGLRYPEGFPILMISGTQDPWFPIDDARGEFQNLKTQGIEVQMVEINDDHYLFLSSPQKLRRIIEQFRDQTSAKTLYR